MQANNQSVALQELSLSSSEHGEVALVIPTDPIHLSPVQDSTVEFQTTSNHTLSAASLSKLLPDQSHTIDLIGQHLQDTVNSEHQAQLLMQIQGEGGTGKSRVTQTMTCMFEQAGVGHWLVKCAYTRIAAPIIGGETTHRVAGLSVNGQ